MAEIEIAGIVDRGFPLCQLMVTLRIDGNLKQIFVRPLILSESTLTRKTAG